MKFRTLSRLIYLRRAQHRKGHGIHSPFLFRLITTVIENKERLPEYKTLNLLKKNAQELLLHGSDPLFDSVYKQFNLPSSKRKKLYNKVEMPIRYAKVIFRLIREFKPPVIFNYGSTFGTHLATMALANSESVVYQQSNNPAYELYCRELLNEFDIPNIRFNTEKVEATADPEFVIINYPENPALARIGIDQSLKMKGDNAVLIIRGIHESKEMEMVWDEIIESNNVRVSLDLFEIGIALFRKGLQKENFVHRF